MSDGWESFGWVSPAASDMGPRIRCQEGVRLGDTPVSASVRHRGDSFTVQLPTHIDHLAKAASWPFIQRHERLSVSALLELARVPKEERDQREQQHRPGHTELPSGVQIRDQKPMPAQALERCLVDLPPAQWHRLINSQVFFWLDQDRLNRQRKACGPRPQMVLVVHTEQLLSRHADRVALSPINSGKARRNPAVRGRSMFAPYKQWSESGWSSEAAGWEPAREPRATAPSS